jgi:hypothetical protein
MTANITSGYARILGRDRAVGIRGTFMTAGEGAGDGMRMPQVGNPLPIPGGRRDGRCRLSKPPV